VGRLNRTVSLCLRQQQGDAGVLGILFPAHGKSWKTESLVTCIYVDHRITCSKGQIIQKQFYATIHTPNPGSNCFGADALNSFSHAGGTSTYIKVFLTSANPKQLFIQGCCALFRLANLFGVVLAFENETVNTLPTGRSDFSACERGSETKHCTSDIKEGTGLNATARYWCIGQ